MQAELIQDPKNLLRIDPESIRVSNVLRRCYRPEAEPGAAAVD
jgi:hypothetical protein